MEQNSKFEGWAVVELFGHSREIGYVTTEYFGSGALFRIEVPALPEREVTLTCPQWIDAPMSHLLAELEIDAACREYLLQRGTPDGPQPIVEYLDAEPEPAAADPDAADWDALVHRARSLAGRTGAKSFIEATAQMLERMDA